MTEFSFYGNKYVPQILYYGKIFTLGLVTYPTISHVFDNNTLDLSNHK